MGQQGSKESSEQRASSGKVVVGTTVKAVQGATAAAKDAAGLLLFFLFFFSRFLSLLRSGSLLLALFLFCVFDVFFCVQHWEEGSHGKCFSYRIKNFGCRECEGGSGSSGS